MQEQVDRLRLRDVLLGGEPDRIDAEQGGIIGRLDVALQLGNHPRAPRTGGLQGARGVRPGLLVNHRFHRDPS